VVEQTEDYDDYRDSQTRVDRFPLGKLVTCYVNPSDPADAVLDRGFSWDILYGLIPLIFLSIGLAGLFPLIPYMSKSERKQRTAP
jgi:hypothetical protein